MKIIGLWHRDRGRGSEVRVELRQESRKEGGRAGKRGYVKENVAGKIRRMWKGK